MTLGALRFAAYAYPPNQLGYCGPGDHVALLEYAAERVVDGGLVALAREFEGAWPYLELIAGCAGVGDPLDDRVVDAYWVGNRLLETVMLGDFAPSLEQRFRGRAGRDWDRIVAAVQLGGIPHHSFHVLNVYPWVGLLRSGIVDHPLHVIEQCMIRPARVLAVDGENAEVAAGGLTWTGGELGEGPERRERVTLSAEGRATAGAVTAGTFVALHWGWVCEVLTPERARRLRSYNRRSLTLCNRAGAPARVG